jgi:hypothetical protein
MMTAHSLAAHRFPKLPESALTGQRSANNRKSDFLVNQGLVARIAEAGRLRVDVVHATALIHAAQAPKTGRDAAPAAERISVHAVALRALLTEAVNVLYPTHQQLTKNVRTHGSDPG